MRKLITGFIVAVSLIGTIALTSLLYPLRTINAEPAFNIEPEKRYIPPPDNRGFDVKVLTSGYPLEEYYAHGKRYIEATESAEYELRITNPLPERVAVALSVDGLNSIDARRTSAWDASKWVIEPYQTITISGWQMSSSRARRFYFTTERDSYAAKLGRASDLGVISAVFYREQRPRPIVRPYPMEEKESRRRSDGRSKESQPAPSASSSDKSGGATSAHPSEPDGEYAATGIGRAVNHNVNWVDLNLTPRPVAALTIRYEYRPALMKLGILPRQYSKPYPLQRRERAQGFEDRRYSPEPE